MDKARKSAPVWVSLDAVAVAAPKDEQLVWESFCNGDDQGLVYIYSKYAPVLYRYGCQLSPRKELIRDCIQELFYDLIDKRSRLAQVYSIKAYLLTSYKRRVLRELKRRERKEAEEKAFSLVLSENFVLSKGLEERDLSLLESKLNQLPVAQREIILLHYYEGLSYAEISQIMDIKVRSVRALNYRALESLQKHLAGHKEDLLLLPILLSITAI